MTKEIQEADILANGTIMGMKSETNPDLINQSVVKDLRAFHPGLVVADAVYSPLETKLLKDAGEAGCRCIHGKGMLMWQAAAGFKEIMGLEMPVEKVRQRFYTT